MGALSFMGLLAPTVPTPATAGRAERRGGASAWSTLAALEEQILDAPAPRNGPEQGKEDCWLRFSPRTGFNSGLVKQIMEVRKVFQGGPL